jgi:hypothetical protein
MVHLTHLALHYSLTQVQYLTDVIEISEPCDMCLLGAPNLCIHHAVSITVIQDIRDWQNVMI